MSRVGFVGSPEKLAEAVISDVRRRIEERIREALEAASKVVETAFEEEYRRLEGELRRAVRSAEEQLRAYAAKREVEERKKLSEILSKAVDEVIEEAMEKLRGYVGEREYEKFIERLLRSAVEELKERGEVTVLAAGPDEQIVRSLVEKLKSEGYPVSYGGAASGRGGFLASVRQAGLTVDYRLEVILAPLLEEARARVLELLRG